MNASLTLKRFFLSMEHKMSYKMDMYEDYYGYYYEEGEDEDDYYEEDEDDYYERLKEEQEEQAQEQEIALNCICGAWKIDAFGQVYHVGDCCCGAE